VLDHQRTYADDHLVAAQSVPGCGWFTADQPVAVPPLDPDGPPELPMFGHGCVAAPPEEGLVGWVDGEVDVVTVVAGLLCVAALATASPAPMLRPKAPPARASVTRGFLSCIIVSFLQVRSY
jgi:hypothetical protein